jgi:hypothetical protein
MQFTGRRSKINHNALGPQDILHSQDHHDQLDLSATLLHVNPFPWAVLWL